MRVFFGMETPLHGRSGGHTGAAPTVSFGGLRMKRLVSFGQIARGTVGFVWWIACKWLFGLCGIAWKNMVEVGRGGAYVPARVALQGRIHRYPPAHNAYVFGMETLLNSPRIMCVFLVWKRRCADVRAGT